MRIFVAGLLAGHLGAMGCGGDQAMPSVSLEEPGENAATLLPKLMISKWIAGSYTRHGLCDVSTVTFDEKDHIELTLSDDSTLTGRVEHALFLPKKGNGYHDKFYGDGLYLITDVSGYGHLAFYGLETKDNWPAEFSLYLRPSYRKVLIPMNVRKDFPAGEAQCELSRAPTKQHFAKFIPDPTNPGMGADVSELIDKVSGDPVTKKIIQERIGLGTTGGIKLVDCSRGTVRDQQKACDRFYMKSGCASGECGMREALVIVDTVSGFLWGWYTVPGQSRVKVKAFKSQNAPEAPGLVHVEGYTWTERFSPSGHSSQASPSFDCTKASTTDEKMLCSNPQLAALDVKMAALYRAARRKASAATKSRIKADQRAFLKQRRSCATALCMSALIQGRIRTLQSGY